MSYEIINNKILITNELGDNVEYEIISYLNNENGNYLVYTNQKELPTGEVEMYISCVVEKDGEIQLEEVTENEFISVIENLKGRLINNG